MELLEITHSLNKAIPYCTLYNSLNKCVTSLGKKKLRRSILQPLCKRRDIADRLQCVTKLVNKQSLLLTLQVTDHF